MRVPSAYPKDHPRGHILRFRSLIATYNVGQPSWLETRAAATKIQDRLLQAQPLVLWLAKALEE